LHGVHRLEVAVNSTAGLVQVQKPCAELEHHISDHGKRRYIVNSPSEHAMDDCIAQSPISSRKHNAARVARIIQAGIIMCEVESQSTHQVLIVFML
jgi:hypothetical protein